MPQQQTVNKWANHPGYSSLESLVEDMAKEGAEVSRLGSYATVTWPAPLGRNRGEKMSFELEDDRWMPYYVNGEKVVPYTQGKQA